MSFLVVKLGKGQRSLHDAILKMSYFSSFENDYFFTPESDENKLIRSTIKYDIYIYNKPNMVH